MLHNRPSTGRRGATGTTDSGAANDTQRRRSRRTRVVAFLVGGMLAGGTGFAASLWVVGVNGGSSGEAQSGTISNLTISAVAAPAAGNLLYPGATGDVVVRISNPNAFPVTITDVQLPANTTYADGFSDSALTAPQAGCSAATPSGVSWSFATGASGSSHALTSALTVAAGGSLTVTFTNAATMGTTSPVACAGTYFKMPSLPGVTASADNAAATAGPATDSWTS
jgi:hypothetical protein